MRLRREDSGPREWPIAGLPGPELQSLEPRFPSAENRLDRVLRGVDRAAGAVGEQQRPPAAVQEYERADERVLASGDERDAIVLGQGVARLTGRISRSDVLFEAQLQLVAGQVAPDPLDGGALLLPEIRVPDGQPGPDLAVPFRVARATLAREIDGEQMPEDLQPVHGAIAELRGEALGELVDPQAEVAGAVVGVAARTASRPGTGGAAQSLATTANRLICRAPAGAAPGRTRRGRGLPNSPASR